MKKCVSFILIMFAAISFSWAQTVVFSDNFDTYTAGAHLAGSNSAWTTWSNQPNSSEDGAISSAQAASQPNSLYITGTNDQVYPFGNYTTGHYTVAFNYYVPSSGSGAYFNVQHVLLSQWAFECYFYTNGSGYVEAGGIQNNFTFTPNSWFPVLFDINLDADSMYIYMDNNLVYSNPFHYQSGSVNGTNQLAGINFYAGAPDNASGTYYVDDFVVTEVSAAAVGHIAVSPTEDVTIELGAGQSQNQTFTLSNPGAAPVSYRIVPTYSITNYDPTSTGATNLTYYTNYVDESAVGFTNGGQYEIAIGFPAEQLQSHIGRALNAIDVYLCDGLSGAAIRVYGMSNLNSAGPGAQVYEQAFTPVQGWNHITLNTPVVIDGGDIWFGVWLDQPAGVYPIFNDGTPANDYSCWYRNGLVWQRFDAEFDNNLCIIGSVDGTPIVPWMTVTPTQGTLNASASQDVTATVAINNGMALGEYNAVIHFFSTDFDTPEIDVNVILNYINVGVNEYDQIEISVYPNPATDYLQVDAEQAVKVEVYSISGQIVYSTRFNGDHLTIPTSDFVAGTYMVKVISANGYKTEKVIIK